MLKRNNDTSGWKFEALNGWTFEVVFGSGGFSWNKPGYPPVYATPDGSDGAVFVSWEPEPGGEVGLGSFPLCNEADYRTYLAAWLAWVEKRFVTLTLTVAHDDSEALLRAMKRMVRLAHEEAYKPEDEADRAADCKAFYAIANAIESLIASVKG